MSSGRRRSGRLIASPWLYNWTKKKPEYVTIDDDGSSGNATEIVTGGSSFKKNTRGEASIKSPGVVATPVNRLDIRSEWRDAERMHRSAGAEEDDDFMTPQECFNSSVKKTAGQDGRKSRCGSFSAKSRASTASIVKQLQSQKMQNSSQGRDVSAHSQPELHRVGSSSSKIPEARRRAARCIANKARLAVRATPSKKDGEKKKRNYEGYLQKKFTPSIITDVMLTLSTAQVAWVKKSGFGLLLGFRMRTYQHRLGYKIADSFCNRTCQLRLKAGNVLITEKLVHKIIGLPLGDMDIELREGKIGKTDWDKQYDGKSVSPFMVMNAIKKSSRADNNFKMNFLVLMYNFFIEANQNRWISRKMLSFGGNLDDCGKYNWCKLLIEKLRKTHSYWAQHKWRNFAGPLAFLIYCYASCLRSNSLMNMNIIYPAYLSWPDDILRERERNETDDDKFGVGSLVLLEEDAQDLEMHEGVCSPRNTENEDVEKHEGACVPLITESENIAGELSMREMVVQDSVSGDSEEEIVGGSTAMEVDKDSDGENVSDSLREAEAVGGEMKNADNHETPPGGPNSQSREDIEIEKHFDEESYMKRFEANLEDLEAAYNRCVTNFIDSMALYLQNSKLAELKKRNKVFFQLFGESSPITKSLSSLCANQGASKNVDREDDTSVPSFSLGLTQMSPRNLGGAIETCAATPAAAVPFQQKATGSTDMDSLHEPAKARPKRDIIPSAVCRSPYVTRVTDISRHSLTSEEKDVWEWLCADKSNQSDYIFEWMGRRCSKAHFHSLEENKQVESTVIDTWTHMLNENELLRSESSPLRMFLTSETIYGPMMMEVLPGDTDARLSRYEAFDDNMEVVLELVNKIHNRKLDIPEFELFLFPVYTGSHHYIICYNIKKLRWEIIDNIVQEMTFEDTYGDLPWKLHDCFCQFLECYAVPRVRDIANLRPTVITMSWQTMDNAVDCGVFVMRHLECYMGNASGWSSGLRCERDNQKNALHKLRAIYLHRMLLWPKNRKRHLVLYKMVNYSKHKLLGDQ